MAVFYMFVHGVPIGHVAILLALVASMGGFIFGYDTGQISDILIMDDFLVRFGTCSNPGVASTCHFTTTRAGLIVSLLSIGTLVGALMGAPIADLLGRRYAMVVECMIFIVGVIIQIAATDVWQQFGMGRWVSGLGVGALSAAVPMYQAETAPARLRGTLTATYQLFITFGIFVAYCISIGTRNMSGAGSWRTVVGIGWLASRGRLDEARHSLARSHGISRDREKLDPFLTDKVEEISTSIENERRMRAGWIDCFRLRHKTAYRTLLGMTLQSFQQLTGANYFFYYGATIFQSVGIQDSFVTQIILGAVNFGCTFGGLYVMQRFGRRLPLIIGGIWQSCWLFVFAAAGTAKIPQDNPGIGKFMIVSACMFIFGYAMTWAPGIWILIGETFPTRTRAKQGALSTASNWLWNFLIAFFTPFIVSAIEFRDLSLESVDLMYNDPNCKPWTSRQWAPPGYRSRYDAVQQHKAVEANKSFVGSGGIDESHIEKANGNEMNSSATTTAISSEVEQQTPTSKV
ncbi:hypothetical protein C0992_005754 [Termitomyces sp. T32_za158]|nr:hypothetical protein C0992_005754 [Termitomyces sp. T32_za158]